MPDLVIELDSKLNVAPLMLVKCFLSKVDPVLLDAALVKNRPKSGRSSIPLDRLLGFGGSNSHPKGQPGSAGTMRA